MSFLDNPVLTLDENGVICWTLVKDLDPKRDKIYDPHDKQFIPFNVYKSSKNITNLIHVRADNLGFHRPYTDIYIHDGLNVEYRRRVDKIVKMPEPLWSSIDVDEPRYAICTQDGNPIEIAGLTVWSWREASWLK